MSGQKNNKKSKVTSIEAYLNLNLNIELFSLEGDPYTRKPSKKEEQEGKTNEQPVVLGFLVFNSLLQNSNGTMDEKRKRFDFVKKLHQSIKNNTKVSVTLAEIKIIEDALSNVGPLELMGVALDALDAEVDKAKDEPEEVSKEV